MLALFQQKKNSSNIIQKTRIWLYYSFLYFKEKKLFIVQIINCRFSKNKLHIAIPPQRLNQIFSTTQYFSKMLTKMHFFSSFVKKLCVSLRHTWALDMAILNPLEDLGIDIKRVQPQLLKVVYIECSFRHFSILNIWYNDSWPFSSSCTSHFHRNWKK